MELSKLSEPFDPKHIEWRVMQSGVGAKGPWAQVAAYLDARAVMDRFDEVCGQGGWTVEYKTIDGGMLCGIGVKMEDGGWVYKWDGSQNTDVEAVKGGISGSLKRAAVVWGVGRYLYDIGEQWANISENGSNHAMVTDKKTNQKVSIKWDAPALPKWAIPAGTKQAKPKAPVAPEVKPNKMLETAADMAGLGPDGGALLGKLAALTSRTSIQEFVESVKTSDLPQSTKDTLVASARVKYQEATQ